MTVQDLIDICLRPVEGLNGKLELPDHIYLVGPKASPPGNRIRLAGRAGPLGRVCSAKESDAGWDVVATFRRDEVFKFLERETK
jgi:hypothetical protein